MIEQKIQALLDAYFKPALFRTIFIAACISGIGVCVLLIGITIILKNLNYAWLIVGIISAFWVVLLAIIWGIIRYENNRLIQASLRDTQPIWLTIVMEFGINYLANKIQKRKQKF